jgi:hypothetical protein
MEATVDPQPRGPDWMPITPKTGSLFHADSQVGIDTAKRCRTDRLPVSLLDTIEKWVEDSGAGELAKWSHAYLAHAGGPTKRDIEAQFVTTNKDSRLDKSPCACDGSDIRMASLVWRPIRQFDADRAVQSVRKAR